MTGNQAFSGEARCYGVPWPLHILSCMEQTTLEKMLSGAAPAGGVHNIDPRSPMRATRPTTSTGSPGGAPR